MKRSAITGLLAASALVPAFAHATTVTTELIYSARNVGLNGGRPLGFNAFTATDLVIANLRFGASASSGDVDASASIRFSSHFDRTVALADASNYRVDFGLERLNFGYSASTGAEAGAFVDFKSFAGINPPEITVIGDSYTLDTSDSRSGFGSTGNARATTDIAGVGPDVAFGLNLRAEVTLDASKTTSFAVSELTGLIQATHESGVVATGVFDLAANASETLNLGLAGAWSLDLLNVDLANSFDSSTGISAGYEIGIGFGVSCGDLSDPDDNFLCEDAGVSGDTAQLSLSDPAPFEINWGQRFVSLGTIDVSAPPPPTPDPAVIPLPAGLPLILSALLGFFGLRVARSRMAA
jgi:hypothetical protein